jgi:hypothetical protein
MKFFNFLFVVGIILILVVGIFVIFYFKTKGVECMADPLKFYENQINDTCYCIGKILRP